MNKGEVVMCQTSDGATALDGGLEQESVWLTQAPMVELFSSTKQNVSLHIHNIFKEGELEKESVVKEYLTTAVDGKKHRIKFYDLDVVLSVGYRVKSQRGIQFRLRANKVLKGHLIKGYALKDNIKLEHDEDLKQAIKVLANVLDHQTLERSEATGLLRAVTDYAVVPRPLDAKEAFGQNAPRPSVGRSKFDNPSVAGESSGGHNPAIRRSISATTSEA